MIVPGIWQQLIFVLSVVGLYCEAVFPYNQLQFGNSLLASNAIDDKRHQFEDYIANQNTADNLDHPLLDQFSSDLIENDLEDRIDRQTKDRGREIRSLQWHGTTTLAFKYDNSIIVCVDSKASTGDYIASKSVKKVIPITSSIVATMAGGAADCFHNIRDVATHLKIMEATEGIDITVRAAAKLLQRLVLQGGQELQLGCMVAGMDSVFGPQLFYVDSSGDLLEGDRFCVGSGSVLAYSALDSALSEARKASMSVNEAIYHAMWAVRHATIRDAFSGGYINVFVITSSDDEGLGNLRYRNAVFKHVMRIDCKELDTSSPSVSPLQ